MVCKQLDTISPTVNKSIVNTHITPYNRLTKQDKQSIKSTNQKEKLMYEGIYIWDAKYGVPTSDDLDEKIRFLEELEDRDYEPNANIYYFYQFLSDFAKEAVEYFADDKNISICIDDEDFRNIDDEFDTVLYFEHPKADACLYFLHALRQGANMYNLVIFDSHGYQIYTPKACPVVSYAQWQSPKPLSALKVSLKDITHSQKNTTTNHKTKSNNNKEKDNTLANPATSNSAGTLLPKSMTQVNELVTEIYKEKLDELGMKKYKTKKGEVPEITIRKENITFKFYTITERHDDEFYRNKNIFVYTEHFVSLQVGGMRGMFTIDDRLFYQKPTKSLYYNKHTLNKTVEELRENIRKNIGMLIYFVEKITDTDSMYHLLSQYKTNIHLKPVAVYNMLYSIEQYSLYELAVITNQPNLDELHKIYRQDWINDKMFELGLKEEIHYAEHKANVIKFNDPDFPLHPFIKPENPEAEFAKEFDYLVNHLTKEPK